MTDKFKDQDSMLPAATSDKKKISAKPAKSTQVIINPPEKVDNKRGFQERFQSLRAKHSVVLEKKTELVLQSKATRSDFPQEVIEQVYKRGFKALPLNTELTREQYAMNRVNSFIAGGAAMVEDCDLLPITERVHTRIGMKGTGGGARPHIKREKSPYNNRMVYHVVDAKGIVKHSTGDEFEAKKHLASKYNTYMGESTISPMKRFEGTKSLVKTYKDDTPGEGKTTVAEETKKGLYYYVNRRKKLGISRDKDHPKAPEPQDWKDAAKNEEVVTEARKPEKDDHEPHPSHGDIGLTKGNVRDTAYSEGERHGAGNKHGSNAKAWGPEAKHYSAGFMAARNDSDKWHKKMSKITRTAGVKNEEAELEEGYGEGDIATGGTVIYKHEGKHVMSKVSHKTGGGAGTKIHTIAKHVVPLHHIVSTDASDWNHYKLKEEVEQIDELSKDTLNSYIGKAKKVELRSMRSILARGKGTDLEKRQAGLKAARERIKESAICTICQADPCICDESHGFVGEARMSASERFSRAFDKQRAKSDASLRRTPSSIPKPEPKKEESK